MADLAAFKAASSLGKARMERSVWEKELKGRVKATMSESLSEVFKQKDEADIRCRSNLLRIGASDPKVLKLWEKVDSGALTLQDAYQAAKALKANGATKPDKRGKSVKAQPSTKEPQPTPKNDLKERFAVLEADFHRLKADIRALPKEVKPLSKPATFKGLKNTAVKSLLIEIRERVYVTLKEHDFLDADKMRLSETTRDFLVTLDDELQSLGRSFERLRGSNRSRGFQNFTKLPAAFRTLGLKPEDVCSPSFDFEHVKQTYRHLAKERHPDRTQDGGEAFRKITEAFKIIEKAYYACKENNNAT